MRNLYVIGNCDEIEAHVKKMKAKGYKVIRVSESNYKSVTKDGDLICIKMGDNIFTYPRNIKFER